MGEIRILLNPDKLELTRSSGGIMLTYATEDAYFADLQRLEQTQPLPCQNASRPRKSRVVIDTAKLGEIAELMHRNPRLSYRELSKLTDISESALKQNAKVQKIVDAQRGSALRDAEERYKSQE